MAEKKEKSEKKPSIAERIKDVDLEQFKPEFNALNEAVQKELKKRKDLGYEAMIEQAEYQRFEEEQDVEIQERFAEIKESINPIFGIIFSPLNVYFSKIGITTIKLEEQQKIQYFVFLIIEKSLKASIIKYSEEIEKGTSALSRIYLFLDILFNIIIPRVQEYYELREKAKAGATP